MPVNTAKSSGCLILGVIPALPGPQPPAQAHPGPPSPRSHGWRTIPRPELPLRHPRLGSRPHRSRHRTARWAAGRTAARPARGRLGRSLLLVEPRSFRPRPAPAPAGTPDRRVARTTTTSATTASPGTMRASTPSTASRIPKEGASAETYPTHAIRTETASPATANPARARGRAWRVGSGSTQHAASAARTTMSTGCGGAAVCRLAANRPGASPAAATRNARSSSTATRTVIIAGSRARCSVSIPAG